MVIEFPLIDNHGKNVAEDFDNAGQNQRGRMRANQEKICGTATYTNRHNAIM